MTHIVLLLKGKGSSRADYVSVHTFESLDEAREFVDATTCTEKKYWSIATIVDSGQEFETHKEYFL